MDPHYAMSGLRPFDRLRDKEQPLLQGEWAQTYLNNRFKLRGVMDSRLEGKYVTVQASEIAMLALRCLVSHPKHRPSMKEVAETLQKIQAHTNQKHLAMCHKAGHYSRSCDKISHVGGNSKLPNASEAKLKEKNSSTQSTVQQDNEASGIVTNTSCKNEKSSSIQSPPQQANQRDEANGIATNKSWHNHPRKTTAIGGDSKLPEARNATKKDKTSSKFTVQHVQTRNEAIGFRTSTCNNSQTKKLAGNSKLPDATNAKKKEKNSAAKSIVQQGEKRNETNGFGASTTRSKGPRKITTSNSELANASEVVKKKKASAPHPSTIQQDTKRNVASNGGTCTKSSRKIAGYKSNKP
ncbi:unnamed protein product [Dovyalis caffra]|uniref:Uncharacterized protein n=1 Tax=Dovyalis caffra TaxID=77055 RepID=A0AAV1S2L6_9ROSI|nr:unnamed protein product [Dovyalis caffra]